MVTSLGSPLVQSLKAKADINKIHGVTEQSFLTSTIKDDKNSHGYMYLQGFSPFGEGTRIILYSISYSRKGWRNCCTQFLILGRDGDEVDFPSPPHSSILILILIF